MKKTIITLLTILLGYSQVHTQSLTQTVRGKVVDMDSQLPLIGAEIILAGTDPLVGTTTDKNGQFRLKNVEVGRINLVLSYIGYERQTIANIVVNSGKEVVLELQMQESVINMETVVITASQNKGEALNDLAVLSARSISPEETNRYAGGFNDPSRIVSNFAGVTATQDGSNDIIVRGNSPKYVQWRLEGVQITNPNHFGDQSAVGGSVSTLNNNMLATSDFYTGAFTAEFGDVLSGVYDLKLRTGNNEKIEGVFGLGLIGTDLTLEGPLKKGYGGSFIVNYRYSTAGLIQDLGLVDVVDGEVKFQDAAIKVMLPTERYGTFSVFALGGLSNFTFEDVGPDVWSTPGDNNMRPDLFEDFDKKAHLLNTGLNHTINIGQNSYLKTTIAYSNEGIDDDVYENLFLRPGNPDEEAVRDSVYDRRLNFDSNLDKSTFRTAVTFNTKLSAKSKLQFGTKYALFSLRDQQSHLTPDGESRFTLVDFDGHLSTVRNYVSWKYRINPDLSFVSGIHNMNVLFNNKSTVEPRLAISWDINPKSTLYGGYGLHSTMESLHNYLTKVEQPDGSISEPNRKLDLLKAHHFVAGFKHRFGQNMRASVEVYYQDLYNLPVENLDTSYYSTINEGLDFRYLDLVNEGTGRNYGIELTLERFFSNNFYYLLNASLYESKYTSLEGVERNTLYNGNYLVNLLVGKEFVKRGKKRNQTLGLNAKVFFGGGRRILPLLRDSDGNLAVDPANNRYWDYTQAYVHKLENLYQVILSASYKWNKPQTTHELFLNLDNITDQKGRISEYYDEDEPGSVGHLTQFGFFPNLMYRVYF